MTKRQQLVVIIGLAISLIFLTIAFRDLKPQEFIAALRGADAALLALAASVYFIAVALISWRWQFLIRAIAPVPLTRLIPLVCIGYMGNNVYPFRSGEALRLLLLYRNERIPLVRGATTVAVERVFDGLVMLSFILVGLLTVEGISPQARQVAALAAPVFLIALVVFFILAARPQWLRGLIDWIAGYLPTGLAGLVRRLAEEILAGLEGLRSPWNLAGAVINSYSCWAVEAGVYWITAQAVGLEAGYTLILLTVGTVNLAGLIPASPGQLGVFEFFVSTVLIASGIDETLAISYAFVVHVVIWLPVTLAGFFFLTRQGLNWRAIVQANQTPEAVTASPPIS